MQEKIYNTYSDYLKKKFGEKVYKLPINLPITCPNRVNGRGGCSFCADVGTGFEALDNILSVKEQLEQNRIHIEEKYNAHKFIAYFQNYTNTWLPLKDFERYVVEAASEKNVVEISVSTRPDCIKKEYLDVLSRIREEYGISINVELGLQTVNYRTLDKINRGHGLAAFIASVLLLKEYDMTVCTHLILNLPYDSMEDVKEMVDIISALPITIVKLHSLYIPKNTKLSYEYEHGKIQLCSYEEYLERLTYFVEHLRPDIILERLFSRIPEEDSVFSNWGRSWWALMEEWITLMKERGGYQGKFYIPSNETAFHNTTTIGW